MFLHVSVILFWGGSASVHAGIHPQEENPPGRHQEDPPKDTPPRKTLQEDTRKTPQEDTPVHAGRYAQQAFDTHPTGMHSCNFCHWSILYRPQCSTVNSRSFLFEGKCTKYLQSILLFRNVLSFH